METLANDPQFYCSLRKRHIVVEMTSLRSTDRTPMSSVTQGRRLGKQTAVSQINTREGQPTSSISTKPLLQIKALFWQGIGLFNCQDVKSFLGILSLKMCQLQSLDIGLFNCQDVKSFLRIFSLKICQLQSLDIGLFNCQDVKSFFGILSLKMCQLQSLDIFTTMG